MNRAPSTTTSRDGGVMLSGGVSRIPPAPLSFGERVSRAACAAALGMLIWLIWAALVEGKEAFQTAPRCVDPADCADDAPRGDR